MKSDRRGGEGKLNQFGWREVPNSIPAQIAFPTPIGRRNKLDKTGRKVYIFSSLRPN